MAVALIENIQREDLNALEEAEALHRLLDEFELTHQQIAESVGKSRTTVTNLLRLAGFGRRGENLCLGRGQTGNGACAERCLGLEEAKQIDIANKAVKQNLSVRAVEKLVRELHDEKPAPQCPKKIDPDTLRLQRELIRSAPVPKLKSIIRQAARVN
jgi:ParB family transcriptional regulator, chromosome partitioning protein